MSKSGSQPPGRKPADTHGGPDRHRELLEAALGLMAEQGYHGASLRKLAARLGIQQPSLYHYFDSKEQLVEQIIEAFSGDMLMLSEGFVVPDRFEDLFRRVADLVFNLYEARPNHALFMRVVYAVSRTHPRFGTLLREIFVDRTLTRVREIVRPFVDRGEVGEEDAVNLVRMVLNAVGMRVMEEKVLFEEREVGPDVRRYADFVVETARLRAQHLRAARGFED